MFPFKYPRTSQPQQPVGIDWRNPITRGLVVCYDGSKYLDVLANKSYAGRVSLSGGSPSVYYSNTGKVLYRGDSYGSGVTQEAYPRYPTSSSNITLFSLVAATSVAETQYCTTSQTVGGVSATIAIGDGSTSVIRGRMYLSGTKYFGGTFSTSDSVTARKLAIVHRQGVSQTLWVDGAADPIVGSYTGSVISHQYFGSYATAPYSKEWLSLVWNRALSDAEIKSLSDNPWQIFAPIRTPIFVGVAAAVSIYRPSSDVTTTGWTGTPDNTDKYKNIDEVTASDTDYITSPSITGGESIIFGLSGSLAAGTWDVRYRANFVGASAQVKIHLLDGSSVSQGASSWQTVTSSYVDYTASVTTTGAATRVKIEVQ